MYGTPLATCGKDAIFLATSQIALEPYSTCDSQGKLKEPTTQIIQIGL
jgi:hypothetical protein